MKKILILSSAALLFAAICVLNVNLGTKSISAKTSGIMFNKALADDEGDVWTCYYPEIPYIPNDTEQRIIDLGLGSPNCYELSDPSNPNYYSLRMLIYGY